MIKKIKNYLHKNEKYFSPLALLGGFVVDNLTLRRIDLLAENILIVIYLSIALFSIFVLNFYHAGVFKHRFFRKTDSIFSLVLQFVFGGLFSVFFVFYFRSASVVSSWVFLLILLSLLFGNELFRDNYKKLTFQILIFFISLFSYLIFLVPLLTKSISKMNFVYSGFFSLFVIVFILLLLYRFFPKRFKLNQRGFVLNLSIIFLLFNFLYFANIIPPIPLSLKKAELVHSLKKTNDGYLVTYEKSSVFSLSKTNDIFSWTPGEPVYFFTAIFSPSDIDLNIIHEWYFFDEELSQWSLKSSLEFSLYGGRDDGYRGYSYKKSLKEGRWKIKVVNELGQVLGVKKFELVENEAGESLTEGMW